MFLSKHSYTQTDAWTHISACKHSLVFLFFFSLLLSFLKLFLLCSAVIGVVVVFLFSIFPFLKLDKCKVSNSNSCIDLFYFYWLLEACMCMCDHDFICLFFLLLLFLLLWLRLLSFFTVVATIKYVRLSTHTHTYKSICSCC